MLTAASHVLHLLPLTFCASESDGPKHQQRIGSHRSLKLGVVDGLVAVSRQAWFPVFHDDDPESPSD